MKNTLSKKEAIINQTFDCGIVMEVLNIDLTKKTLTILVNSKDEWNGCSLISALEYINSEAAKIAQNDNSAMGYKCTGFKLVQEKGNAVKLEKFVYWEPQHIAKKANQS